MKRTTLKLNSSGECDRCGYKFQLSDTIYVAHIWLERRDVCEACREAVLLNIDNYPKDETQQLIA